MEICICYHHLHLSHFGSILNPIYNWTLQPSHAVIKCWPYDSCLISWYGSPFDKILTHLWLPSLTRHAKVLPPFYDMLLWILQLLWQALPLICSNHRINCHRYQLKKRIFLNQLLILSFDEPVLKYSVNGILHLAWPFLWGLPVM